MRSLALVLPASLIFVFSAHGQALTEHAAAAAGAAVGVGAGKSLSNSMTKIFGDTDKETAKAAKPDAKKPDQKPQQDQQNKQDQQGKSGDSSSGALRPGSDDAGPPPEPRDLTVAQILDKERRDRELMQKLRRAAATLTR